SSNLRRVGRALRGLRLRQSIRRRPAPLQRPVHRPTLAPPSASHCGTFAQRLKEEPMRPHRTFVVLAALFVAFGCAKASVVGPSPGAGSSGSTGIGETINGGSAP